MIQGENHPLTRRMEVSVDAVEEIRQFFNNEQRQLLANDPEFKDIKNREKFERIERMVKSLSGIFEGID